MSNDVISTATTWIRNAALAKHQLVTIPLTSMTKSLVEILVEENFIDSFSEVQIGRNRSFVVSLKYSGEEQKSAITKIQTISKRGVRIYSKANKIPKVLDGFGIAIISTSRGIMTDRKARQEKVGGEVLCYVW